MCSYNRLNNSYACQNSYLMNGLLKKELGFQGFIVSDWHGQHSGLASAEAGLDMAMPDSPYWHNDTLSIAVQNGSLPESRLNDMATRILATWFKYAEIENPGHGFAPNLTSPHEIVDARDPEAKSTLSQSAVEGHVLVKNSNNALPLGKPKFLSLFGYDAMAVNHNTMENADYGLWNLGLDNSFLLDNGQTINLTALHQLLSNGTNPVGWPLNIARNGTLISGGASGSSTPAYIDAPFDAFQRQAYEDNTFLAWDFRNAFPVVNPASEACIVFINALASEGWDRPSLNDPYSDALIDHIASQHNNTMVVIHNAGIRIVDPWITNPNITAVIFAHLPGQDTSRALIEIMYGKHSPSGRLPYTVAKQESDYGSLLSPVYTTSESPTYYTQDNFTEGLYIDYKHFIAHNITPRYEFGFVLSYTTFSYSDLIISSPSDLGITDLDLPYLPPDSHKSSSPTPQGGHTSLFTTISTVSLNITNTGTVPPPKSLNCTSGSQDRIQAQAQDPDRQTKTQKQKQKQNQNQNQKQTHPSNSSAASTNS